MRWHENHIYYASCDCKECKLTAYELKIYKGLLCSRTSSVSSLRHCLRCRLAFTMAACRGLIYSILLKLKLFKNSNLLRNMRNRSSRTKRREFVAQHAVKN